MKIKTIYSNYQNYEQKLRDKEVHIIAFAEEGKSVFKAHGHFIGNISQEVLLNFVIKQIECLALLHYTRL